MRDWYQVWDLEQHSNHLQQQSVHYQRICNLIEHFLKELAGPINISKSHTPIEKFDVNHNAST